jgi:hypothetical protein
MNGTYGLSEAYDEAYDETDEAFDEAYDEAYDEARRGGGRRGARMPPVNVPRTPSTYKPRPGPASAQGVTQAQLREALAKVSQQFNVTNGALRKVDGRVRAVAGEVNRLDSNVRKEITDRKQSVTGVRKDLQSTREVVSILPLLTTLSGNSTLAAFAPLLLLGTDVSAEPSAAAASGSSTGFLGLGGNNLIGIVALLAITGGLGGKKAGA